MKRTCKDCKGTGTLPGYHAEDDGRCCDDPVAYYCDSCEEEIHDDAIHATDLDEEYHICEKCDLSHEEEDYSDRKEWVDSKFPASEKR